MEEDVIKKPENGYVSGTIGAVIGGIIGAIPWVLCYFFINMIVGLLAMLIALGALKGYQVFKGRITKTTKKIIIVVTLIIVAIIPLVLMPAYISYINNIEIAQIYTHDLGAIIYDSFLSIICALFGIGLSIGKINNTLKKDDGVEAKLGENGKKYDISAEQQNEAYEVKKVFQEYNALDKKNAIEKEKILEKLNFEDNEKMFKKYLSIGLINKYKKKYYYVEKNERNLSKWYLLIFIVIIAVMALNSSNVNENVSNSNKEISMVEYQYIDTNLYAEIPNTFYTTKKDENGVIMFYSEDGSAECDTLVIEKSELEEGITLEDYKVAEEQYIHGIYSEALEAGEMQKCSFDTVNAYKLNCTVDEESGTYNFNDYLIETENYIVSIYTYSTPEMADINNKLFDDIVKSIVEK